MGFMLKPNETIELQTGDLFRISCILQHRNTGQFLFRGYRF